METRQLPSTSHSFISTSSSQKSLDDLLPLSTSVEQLAKIGVIWLAQSNVV